MSACEGRLTMSLQSSPCAKALLQSRAEAAFSVAEPFSSGYGLMERRGVGD